MNKKQLRKSEIKELNDLINSNYSSFFNFNKKDNVEVVKTDDFKLVLLDNEVVFLYYNDLIIPSLKFILKNNNLPIKRIAVDMGAVKFVTSGADIMRPGIVDIDDGINEKDIVIVVDENNKKPLAVCLALFNSDKLKEMTTGKVLKNIHYVGDKIWNYE
ncbi:MAG: DUF1947 domain-containing protein [Candidatus Woesearchaeota archaeon]